MALRVGLQMDPIADIDIAAIRLPWRWKRRERGHVLLRA